MKFLYKKPEDKPDMPHARQRAASPTTVLSSLEHRAAAWLQQKTRHVSKKAWLYLLILFVLSTGSYSAYLIVRSFGPASGKLFTIGRIPLPQHTQAREAKKAKPGIPLEGYQRIQRFRMYRDSPARSPSGRAAYDSIAGRHPGLLDSMHHIELQYQSFKTK